MKAQVLVDFLIECTWSNKKLEEVSTEQSNLGMTWILHVDGALNFQGSRAGLILINMERVVIKYTMHFLFKTTNNQAKYEALLAGLKLVKELRAINLKVFIDSQHVDDQVTNEYEV